MITDYEYRYRISGGSFVAPIQCTVLNSIDNGDGTITITDIPEGEILAGDFQVRTRAINGKGASAWLVSDAAFDDSGIPPTLFLDSIPYIGVGDSVSLAYSSNSEGLITFSSSDPLIATVLKEDGFITITGVSSGSFNILMNQVASGEYSEGQTSISLASEDGLRDTTTVYSDYSTGKSSVSDGGFFAVEQNDKTKRVYQKVGSDAFYRRTVPLESVDDVSTIHKLIYEDGVSGVLPTGVNTDIDAVDGVFSFNKLTSTNQTDTVDSFLIYPTFTVVTTQGTIIRDYIEDFAGKPLGAIVTFPTISGADFPSFLSLAGSYEIPEGVWTYQVDIQVPEGEDDVTIYYANKFIGVPYVDYKPHVATEEITTIVFDKFELTSPTILDGYPMMIATSNTTTAAEKTVIIKNVKLVPISTEETTDISDKELTLWNPSNIISDGFQDDLSIDWSSFHESLYLNKRDNQKHSVTIIFGIKSSELLELLYAATESSASSTLAQYDDGRLSATSMFSSISEKGWLLNNNKTLIVTLKRDEYFAEVYVNGSIIAKKISQELFNEAFNGFEILGFRQSETYTFNGKLYGVMMWLRGLDGEEIKQATDVMKKRILYKGELVKDEDHFVISEGDSITWMPNSYQFLLRKEYEPKLEGSCPAESGATLGQIGDDISVNSIYGRKEWVLGMAQEQINKNKNVILIVDIGANNVITINNSEDAIAFYEGLVDYIADFREIGVKVIACTIMDIASLTDKTYLNQINSLITGDSSVYDGLSDFYASPLLTPNTPTYFTDGLHPNDLGFETMRDIIKPVLDTLI